jgi:hypothetical protein
MEGRRRDEWSQTVPITSVGRGEEMKKGRGHPSGIWASRLARPTEALPRPGPDVTETRFLHVI